MLASIPVISPVFQVLLNAIGWVLAEIYRFIPNYGVAIVILTLLLKFLLLPMGIKQIKSMLHMQAIQPKVKELQKKYKGNKAKAQEETMKLYREAGVSPLGGCLPLLLTFPFLISMYAVIRMPILEAVPTGATGAAVQQYVVHNNHLPVDSRLFQDVISHQHTSIGIMNLQCSPAQGGSTAQLTDSSRNSIVDGKPLIDGNTVLNGDPKTGTVLPSQLRSSSTLDCGTGAAAKIPYFVLLLLMVATTFYQQRQMTKASPPGASSQQQQAIMKFMPLMFAVIGFNFPGGLGLYWTVTNLFQIGQQSLLLRAGHIGPEALERRIAEQKEKLAASGDRPVKKGFLARMMEQAEVQKQAREGTPPPRGRTRGGTGAKGGTGGGTPKGGSGTGTPKGGSGTGTPKGGTGSTPPRPQGPRRKPNTGGNKGGGGGPKKRPGGGGGGASRG